jgi:predicted nucleic acid-binding Zn ribbon protein
MKKAITAAAVHFKGSGWARKDRSDATRSARATTKESDKVAGGASDSSSAESSPTSESSATATVPAPKPESTGQAPD